MNFLSFVALLSLGLIQSSFAEQRTWREATGDRTIKAEFVSRDADKVTLRRQDDRVVTLTLADLHPDDQAWLKKNHPLPGEEPREVAGGTAFDNLDFGDHRDEVEKKLLESKAVFTDEKATAVGSSIFGFPDLNGIYQTREKIGGLSFFLHFHWTGDAKLSEVTLQSQLRERTAYNTELNQAWQEMITLLSALHGPPVKKSNFPDSAKLSEGVYLMSHLWKNKHGNSVILGTGIQEGQYRVVARITTEEVDLQSSP